MSVPIGQIIRTQPDHESVELRRSVLQVPVSLYPAIEGGPAAGWVARINGGRGV